MNTNVSISTKSSGGGGGKSMYVKIREKQGVEARVNILVDNEFLPDLKVLSPVEKKERVQLQKNLHIYKKRLEVAIEKDKPKVIANNQKKIDEIQAKLDEPIRKGSEKRIIDMTVSLVNSMDAKEFTPEQQNFFDALAKKFYEEEFSDLHIVTIASHYDQNSPHTHGIMQLQPHHESWEQYLLDKYDTKDASEAYSIIQHRWHDYAESYNLEVDELKKGRLYVPIGQYKAYGNRHRPQNTAVEQSFDEKYGDDFKVDEEHVRVFEELEKELEEFDDSYWEDKFHSAIGSKMDDKDALDENPYKDMRKELEELKSDSKAKSKVRKNH